MKKERKNLILAAFFHDVGKFIQRSKKFEETHAQLSELFTQVINKKLGQKNTPISDELDFNFIAKLSSIHHEQINNLNNDEQKWLTIIQRADRLAAATQREIKKTMIDDPTRVNQNDIFSFIFGQSSSAGRFVHQIHGLYEIDRLMPISESDQILLNNLASYRSLLDKKNFGYFLTSLLSQKRDFLSFLYSLDEIFHLVYTQIPEDRRDEYQLNSLYDHLKLTTLFSYLFSYSEHFYPLTFDIEGIQKFIFDIKAKKAAKILRGRSLFIQILTEMIIFDLIKRFDLIPQVVINNAGGNVLMFLPQKDDLPMKLNNYLFQLSAFLLTQFSLGLRVNDFTISYPLNKTTIESLFLKQLSTDDTTKGKTINQNISLKKSLKELVFELKAINDQIRPEPVNDSSLCDFCQNPLSKKYSTPEEKKCHQCHLYLTLSRLILEEKPIKTELNLEKKQINLDSYLPGKEKNIFVIKPFKNLLNQKDQLKNYFPIPASKTIFYTVTTPKNLSFEDMVKNKDSAPLLLYLKGDVDNMSEIITHGFNFRSQSKENKKGAVLTDLIHFSRRINLFFQNYLPYLIERDEKFKNDIYLVYSGGDDFFLIGYWATVLEFIFQLKEEFKKFVCFNERIHFSLGGFLAKPNDPVFLMSEKVEKKLKEAKNGGKNRFSFLFSNTDIDNWQKIFQMAREINDAQVSDSFFYKVFRIADYLLNQKNFYQKAVGFYKICYHYYRLLDSNKDISHSFKNFFNQVLTVPKKSDQEIDLYRENLKTMVNLILLWRRKGGEKNE